MRALSIVLTAGLAMACSGAPPWSGTGGQPVPFADLPAIDMAAVLAHTTRLASDEFEGRAPGGRGEAMTVEYLEAQFRALGLLPGSPAGTYIQRVPLVGITSAPAPLLIAKGAARLTLDWRDDVVATTRRVVDQVDVVDSEIVFVGYGTVAPEYGWDDYKGLDVTGKTVLMLVGDPPVRSMASPSGLDPAMFGGTAMTYYGRWTYKYEIASEKGAAAVFLIHETEAAGYPFEVVQSGWTGEQFDLASPDRNMSRVAIEGWISLEQAHAVFALAEHDLGALTRTAATRGFQPTPLGLQASMTLRNTLRTMDSRNVIARLDGNDPDVRDEAVIYTAHWDHLGIGAGVEGDTIYNGAIDNAVGTAGLLEIARAFTRLSEPPRRSILFLAVTGEEAGLLGSQHYTTAPTIPMAKTAAAINIDTLNVHGRTSDVTVIGLGASDLDRYLEAAVGEQGRVVRPDPTPEIGSYYRSDHLNFAKAGVPSLFINEGMAFVDRPADHGERVRAEYIASIYHQPSDEVRPTWDLTGARDDLQAMFAVGLRVAEAGAMPEWASGNEFRRIREASIAADR